MLKLLTIVGTRPELIRLSCSIPLLDNHFEHKLIYTTQNYDPNLFSIFLDDLDLRQPDYTLDISSPSAANFIGSAFIQFDAILDTEQPDGLLILGDTNSALLSILAKKRQVPIFHVEAGNRCFDQRVPEEVNRRIVDHISDINVTYSQVAKQNLLLEGLSQDKTFCLGSPMNEVLLHYEEKIASSQALKTLNLSQNNYILVSIHRQENTTTPRIIRFFDLISRIYDRYRLPVVMSLHPRTRSILDSSSIDVPSFVTLHQPFDFTSYCHLQMNSFLVLSDSGSLTEESSLLGFDALNIRSAQERHEGFEQGAVVLADMDCDVVMSTISLLKGHSSTTLSPIPHPDYTSVDFSVKLLKLILSNIRYPDIHVSP